MRQYRDVFNTEYNIGFFKPKKDLCALCEKWKKATREERLSMVREYGDHLKNYKRVKQLREEEKNLQSVYCKKYPGGEKVVPFPWQRSEGH